MQYYKQLILEFSLQNEIITTYLYFHSSFCSFLKLLGIEKLIMLTKKPLLIRITSVRRLKISYENSLSLNHASYLLKTLSFS